MLSSWFGLEPIPICSIDLARPSAAGTRVPPLPDNGSDPALATPGWARHSVVGLNTRPSDSRALLAELAGELAARLGPTNTVQTPLNTLAIVAEQRRDLDAQTLTDGHQAHRRPFPTLRVNEEAGGPRLAGIPRLRRGASLPLGAEKSGPHTAAVVRQVLEDRPPPSTATAQSWHHASRQALLDGHREPPVVPRTPPPDPSGEAVADALGRRTQAGNGHCTILSIRTPAVP